MMRIGDYIIMYRNYPTVIACSIVILTIVTGATIDNQQNGNENINNLNYNSIERRNNVISSNSFRLNRAKINKLRNNLNRKPSQNHIASFKPNIVTLNSNTHRYYNQSDTLNHWVKKRNKTSTVSNENTNKNKKPVIRKVLTRWTDDARLDNIDYRKLNENNKTKNLQSNDFHKIGNKVKFTIVKGDYDDYDTNPNYGFISNNDHQAIVTGRPTAQTQVISNNIQVLDVKDKYDNLIVTTRPSPTPIVTHDGFPTTAQQNHLQAINQQSYTSNEDLKEEDIFKPIVIDKFSEQSDENESGSYTDQIVIKPFDKTGITDDCPTVYLTLNNTVKQEGKQVCPDLNIAVNTNFVNKNVIVSSQETESEEIMNPFINGVPFISDSSEEEISAESQSSGESIGIKQVAVTSGLNDAPNGPNYETTIPINIQGSQLAPTKSQQQENDDEDGFLSDWVKPASTILNWFSVLNPFNFGVFSIILAPLALLLAGSSGVVTLIAPWALPYARNAPKIVHVYRPQWKWDQDHQYWDWHELPDTRRLTSNPTYTDFKRKPTRNGEFSQVLKDWFTSRIGDILNTFKIPHNQNIYKHTRKKRFIQISPS